ncbi:hypothetical protein [Persicitalea sp.]|uniref:hypothetical protein n=1 Tax=Persicitalea sp. TaxID=3100273 RepID=UPI0035930CBA
MLSLKKLTENEEINQFVSVRAQNLGAPVSMEYLAQASIYAVHRHATPDLWLGGFVVSAERKRYLEVVPACELQRLESEMIPPNETVEISCIWKNTFNEPSAGEIAQMYLHALMEAFRSGKEYILGGTIDERIRRIQMTVFRNLLYHGNVDLQDESHQAWLYYCRREEVFEGFMRYTRIFVR